MGWPPALSSLANPATWQSWNDAGLAYDSTLGFPEHVGFRCGVCREFPAFNVTTREQLRLRERPLVVMDETLFGYMALEWRPALEKILKLRDTCRRLEGDFTLLWHNSSLTSRREKAAICRAVRGAMTTSLTISVDWQKH